MKPDPNQLAEQGKQAFRNKNFDEAADLFAHRRIYIEPRGTDGG